MQTIDSPVPRPEYPRPTMVRPDWLNLNGTWSFEIDHDDSGLERGLLDRELEAKITLPFAPESELSGIGHTDFMAAVWYRREVDIPEEWTGRDVLLHFGAVDHDATVWVDGVEVARHRGGHTPFTAELRGVTGPGRRSTIVVRARDHASAPQARGKQSRRHENYECYYTRTTGIWQTVWLEPVPKTRLGRPRITPDVGTSTFHITMPLSANRSGWTLRVELFDEDGSVGKAVCSAAFDLAPSVRVEIPRSRLRLWAPGCGHLYRVVIDLLDQDGTVHDTVESHAGMRSIAIDGQRVLVNGATVFQRLVLDQGYYPDGVMTAPTDDDLARDIELAMAAGFNGARLHQKVFEERFLYHADRMGYLVWAEFADWGVSGFGLPEDHQRATPALLAQWLEVLERDQSHPSIVGWCPLNETWQLSQDRITDLDDATLAMFTATKLVDPTRPVIDASGYSHRVPASDVYDAHNYEQDPAEFRRQVAGLAEGRPFVNEYDGKTISIPYRGQPYFVSEYGGIWWNPDLAHAADGRDRQASWGYGARVGSDEEFYRRFADLADILLDDPLMFGYCYTQLTDVYQEQNGIYRFDRTPKFNIGRIAAVQGRTAAVEQLGSSE